MEGNLLIARLNQVSQVVPGYYTGKAGRLSDGREPDLPACPVFA